MKNDQYEVLKKREIKDDSKYVSNLIGLLWDCAMT